MLLVSLLMIQSSEYSTMAARRFDRIWEFRRSVTSRAVICMQDEPSYSTPTLCNSTSIGEPSILRNLISTIGTSAASWIIAFLRSRVTPWKSGCTKSIILRPINSPAARPPCIFTAAGFAKTMTPALWMIMASGEPSINRRNRSSLSLRIDSVRFCSVRSWTAVIRIRRSPSRVIFGRASDGKVEPSFRSPRSG